MAKKKTSYVGILIGIIIFVLGVAAAIFMVCSPAFSKIINIGAGSENFVTETTISWNKVLFSGTVDGDDLYLSPVGLASWICLLCGIVTGFIAMFLKGKNQKITFVVTAVLLVAAGVMVWLAPSNFVSFNASRMSGMTVGASLTWGTYVAGILIDITAVASIIGIIKA